MNAIVLMQRIVAMERQGLAALDAPMLDLLSELLGYLPAILTTLGHADDACASLENVLCHLGDRMTAADQRSRSRVAAELLQSLQVLSGHPGQQLHKSFLTTPGGNCPSGRLSPFFLEMAMPQNRQLPDLGKVLSFKQWEAAVIALLQPQPKGTALKVGEHGAIMLLLDELIYLEDDDQVRAAGGCDATGWSGENIASGLQALNKRQLFQRCTAEEFDVHELEILQFFLHGSPGHQPRYEDFVRVARAMLIRHPVGTALQVEGGLDYLLVGDMLSCIESQSSIDGLCLRDAGSWPSMTADLAALRAPMFYQRFAAEEIEAYLREEPPAAPGVDTTHMSALAYEIAVMELLCEQPKGTGLKDSRGAIFIINGELMHVATGKGLEDATDCDPEAWGDTDPAPDIEALHRAELVQVFSTAAVIAFEQEHCP